MVVGLDVVLADGRADHHRRLRRAPRSAPTSPSCSSAPRARSASSPARGSGCTRRPPRERRGGVRVRRLRRRARRVPAHPAPRRDARGAPALRRDRGRPLVPDRPRPPRPARARRGRPADRRRDDGRRRRGVHGRGARSTSTLVEQWLGHRNDVQRARGADPARLRGRHDGDLGAVVALLRAIYEAATAAIRAVPGTLVASAHQSHSYPDGACLYFTFAGQPARRREGRVLPGRVGRRDARGARARRRAEPPPRRRPQPVAVRARRARPGVRRARGREAGARPERHPQPGQARAARPVGRRRPGHDRALPNRGAAREPPRRRRRDVVGAGRDRRGRRHASTTSSSARSCPTPRHRDWSSSTPPRWRRPCSTPRAPALAIHGGPVDAVGITNQRGSTIVWDRATGEPIGPGIGWQDLRTIGSCLEQQANGFRFAPNVSATKIAYLLDTYDPDRDARPVLRHRRLVDRVDARRRARST